MKDIRTKSQNIDPSPLVRNMSALSQQPPLFREDIPMGVGSRGREAMPPPLTFIHGTNIVDEV